MELIHSYPSPPNDWLQELMMIMMVVVVVVVVI